MIYAYANDDAVNLSDANGHWFGGDDLVASVGGAVVGVAVQTGFDAWNGEVSSWKEYAASAVGGAAAGEAALYSGGLASGAAGGVAYATARAALDGEAPSVGDLVASGAAGAVGGKIGQKLGVAVASKLSKAAKGTVGVAIAGGKQLARGNVVVQTQVKEALTGAGPKKTIVDLKTKNIVSGAVSNVESKFRMDPTKVGTLTAAQLKAQSQLSNYTVVQSNSSELGRITSLPGSSVAPKPQKTSCKSTSDCMGR